MQVGTVVNCFQISIFAVHEQPVIGVRSEKVVVNCFQISIFAVHEQQEDKQDRGVAGCELLSN